MTPPINLDGDTVDAITMDGDSVTELTVDGSPVFSAIPDGLVDNFEKILYEDQSKTLADYYDGNTSSFDRQQSVVKEGSYALSVETSGSQEIRSTSGLPNYPSTGDTFRCWGQGNDSGFRWYVLFGVQDQYNHYRIQWGNNLGGIELEELTSSGDTILDSDTSITVPSGAWREFEIEWQSSTITVRLLDETGSEITSISGNSSEFSSGGIGWRANASGTTTNYYDNLRIV